MLSIYLHELCIFLIEKLMAKSTKTSFFFLTKNRLESAKFVQKLNIFLQILQIKKKSFK